MNISSVVLSYVYNKLGEFHFIDQSKKNTKFIDLSIRETIYILGKVYVEDCLCSVSVRVVDKSTCVSV